MNTVKFKFPGRATWEKLIGRWSDFPDCGEKKLVCAVIAQAIADHHDQRQDFRLIEDKAGFFGLMLEKYCRLIALDASYVRRQILVAARRDGDLVGISA